MPSSATKKIQEVPILCLFCAYFAVPRRPNGETCEATGHQKFAALLPNQIVGQGWKQSQQTCLGTTVKAPQLTLTQLT